MISSTSSSASSSSANVSSSLSFPTPRLYPLGYRLLFFLTFYSLGFTVIASCILFYRRRHLTPIRQRQPLLVIAYCMGFALYLLSCSMYVLFAVVPCGILILMSFPSILSAVSLVAWRAIDLSFAHRTTQYQLALMVAHTAALAAAAAAAAAAQTPGASTTTKALPLPHSAYLLPAPTTMEALHATYAPIDYATYGKEARSCFVRNMRWRRSRCLMGTFGVAACLFIALMLVCVFVTPGLFEPRGCAADSGASTQGELGTTAVCVAAILVLITVSRQLPPSRYGDAFGIQAELRTIVYIEAPLLLVWIISQSLWPEFQLTQFPLTDYIGGWTCAVCCFVSLWQPLRRSYTVQRASDAAVAAEAAATTAAAAAAASSVSSPKHRPVTSRVTMTHRSSKVGPTPASELTIDDLLVDPQGCQYLRQYLALEHSLENLSFLIAVEEYRSSSMDDTRRVEQAVRLYAQYISPSAPLQVNLPFEAVRTLRLQLRSYLPGERKSRIYHRRPGPVLILQLPQEAAELEAKRAAEPPDAPPIPRDDLFDDAHQCIANLLQSDVLPRFRRSVIFTEYMTARARAQGLVPRVALGGGDDGHHEEGGGGGPPPPRRLPAGGSGSGSGASVVGTGSIGGGVGSSTSGGLTFATTVAVAAAAAASPSPLIGPDTHSHSRAVSKEPMLSSTGAGAGGLFITTPALGAADVQVATTTATDAYRLTIAAVLTS